MKLDITGNFLEREVLSFIEMDKGYRKDVKAFYEDCTNEAKDKFSDLDDTVLKGKTLGCYYQILR